MALHFPPNIMPIAFQLLGVVSDLMQKADAAFSGKPGSGAKKKEWVMEAAADLVKTGDLIKVDLMTSEQEASVLVTVDKLVEFVFSAVDTAKLFHAPAGKPAVK